jgi:hypothetical protein
MGTTRTPWLLYAIPGPLYSPSFPFCLSEPVYSSSWLCKCVSSMTHLCSDGNSGWDGNVTGVMSGDVKLVTYRVIDEGWSTPDSQCAANMRLYRQCQPTRTSPFLVGQRCTSPRRNGNLDRHLVVVSTDKNVNFFGWSTTMYYYY